MPRFDIGRIDAGFKASMKSIVNSQAETARLRFVTGGSAKAMEYEAKREEAQRFKDAGYPSSPFVASTYPLVNAQKEAFAQTPTQAADTILAAHAAWLVAAASISLLSLTANRAIDNATTMAQARSATQGIAWPTPP